MAKKLMKLLSLFNTKQPLELHPWQFFPSCYHLKTLSFRTTISDDDDTNHISFSTEPDLLDYSCNDYDSESLEILVRGISSSSSERLFFEPNGDTNSMLQKAKKSHEAVSETEGFEVDGGVGFKESSMVMVDMESEDPYEDFRRSMEEIVEFHGVREWEGLEELLSLYLMINEKKNEGFIVGAFLDLVSNLASSSNSNCSSVVSYSSVVSSLSNV